MLAGKPRVMTSVPTKSKRPQPTSRNLRPEASAIGATFALAACAISCIPRQTPMFGQSLAIR